MIHGAKVKFRAIERDDLPRLRDWRNSPAIRRRIREFRLLSLVDQERWSESLRNDRHTIMFDVLDEKDTLIGVAGLTYIDWKDRRAEVSIYVGDEGAQGMG